MAYGTKPNWEDSKTKVVPALIVAVILIVLGVVFYPTISATLSAPSQTQQAD